MDPRPIQTFQSYEKWSQPVTKQTSRWKFPTKTFRNLRGSCWSPDSAALWDIILHLLLFIWGSVKFGVILKSRKQAKRDNLHLQTRPSRKSQQAQEHSTLVITERGLGKGQEWNANQNSAANRHSLSGGLSRATEEDQEGNQNTELTCRI